MYTASDFVELPTLFPDPQRLPAFGHPKLGHVKAPIVPLAPNTKVVPNSYIITLKESCKFSTHIQWLRGLEEKYHSTPEMCKLMYEYKLVNSYSATLGHSALEEVQGSPDVEDIIPNQEVQACMEGPELDGRQNIVGPPKDVTPAKTGASMEAESNIDTIQPVIQTDAPWNLRRINQRNPLPNGSDFDRLDFPYYHLPPPVEPERTVDIYVLDSGVSIEHVDFGSRARRPAGPEVPRPYGVGDDFGHGTHVAGTAAGARWGVAKHAHIVDVK
ncbi:serine protease, partial [Ceratobasidium sp. 428]